jgi:hypothetical protein
MLGAAAIAAIAVAAERGGSAAGERREDRVLRVGHGRAEPCAQRTAETADDHAQGGRGVGHPGEPGSASRLE